ncbi:MAG: peroxidase family protein [Verrucomicrobiales bacterium]
MVALVTFSAQIGLAEDRSFDGLGNNLTLGTLGAAGTNFSRVAPAAYDDGASAPAVGDRANSRVISNAVCHSGSTEPNPYRLSDYVWQWGQFIDHDITLSDSVDEPFFIEVGAGDPLEGFIPLMRTVYDLSTGTDSPREQVNGITAFLDASMVYGSDGIRASALRSFSDGRLKTSADDLMPMNTSGLPNANDLGLPENELFLGGDVRSNEQLGLTCVHTIFLREHNRLAAEIAGEHPMWDDEQIYQRARKIVGALVQVITYREFLPAILGPIAPDPTSFSYDPGRDPSITNEFSAALYRIGHTMVSDQLVMMDESGQPAPIPSISVLDAFFTPSTLISDPQKVDWILMGLSMQTQQQADTKVVHNLRNQLFGPAGAGGLDLAAMNVQRGRDHGLAGYNDTRAAYGLARKESFDEITSDPTMQAALASVYEDVDEIDLWIGSLAEEHLTGVCVGELTAMSMLQQFVDLAEGDRFFYRFDPELADMVEELEATTLSDILVRNSGLSIMGSDVFHVDQVREPLASASRVSIGLTGSDATVTLRSNDPAATFALERTMDSAVWETVASDLVVEDGEVNFTDTGIGDLTRRVFYRFRQELE